MFIRCSVIALGNSSSALMARVMGFAPGKLLSYDNYLSMQIDSVCHDKFPEVFGITPGTVETIVPSYLGAQNKLGRFDNYRHQARHD